MKLIFDEMNDALKDVVNIFNSVTRLNGRFKLVFEAKNRITDSDGTTIIEAYMIPMNQAAKESISGQSHDFLHLQLLGSIIPEQYWGYEYTFQIENCSHDNDKVDLSVSKLDWKDRNLSEALFTILNTNISLAC
jgi:hypothetical protein